jgi:hypothetical protein
MNQSVVIRENSRRLYKEKFSYNSTIILFLLLALCVVGSLYFVMVFANELSFSFYAAIALFVVAFGLIFVHFYEASFGCMTFSFSLSENLPGAKTFYQNFIRSFAYPFRGGLRIFFNLCVSVLIFILLSSVSLYIATSVAYNTSNEIKSFVDGFNQLVNSGATTSALFDYYNIYGKAYDDIILYVNLSVISVSVVYFVHVTAKNHLVQALLFGSFGMSLIPVSGAYQIFRKAYYSNYKKINSLYFKVNFPFIIGFYVIYIGMVVLLSFFSTNYLFVVGAALVTCFMLYYIFFPIFIYNNLQISAIIMPEIDKALKIINDEAIARYGVQSGLNKSELDSLQARIEKTRQDIVNKLNDPDADADQVKEDINKALEDINNDIMNAHNKDKDKNEEKPNETPANGDETSNPNETNEIKNDNETQADEKKDENIDKDKDDKNGQK